MNVWMHIDTSDEFLLPLGVYDTINDICKAMNCSPCTIHKSHSRSHKSNRPAKYILVSIDDNEEDL